MHTDTDTHTYTHTHTHTQNHERVLIRCFVPVAVRIKRTNATPCPYRRGQNQGKGQSLWLRTKVDGLAPYRDGAMEWFQKGC